MQIRLSQTDACLMHAVKDALARIRHDKLGICAECGRSTWKARLRAVLGPGGAEIAMSRRILNAETQSFTAIRADILVSIWCLFL